MQTYNKVHFSEIGKMVQTRKTNHPKKICFSHTLHFMCMSYFQTKEQFNKINNLMLS